MNKRRSLAKQLLTSIPIAIGLVLVWRSLWYIVDGFDLFFFAGDHTVSVIAGLVIGILLLYLPDRDLKEIEKL